jgi:hypothetical protein
VLAGPWENFGTAVLLGQLEVDGANDGVAEMEESVDVNLVGYLSVLATMWARFGFEAYSGENTSP